MSIETIARTITTAVLAVNAVLVMCGITLVEGATEENVYIAVTAIVTPIYWFYGVYKNCDFSAEASEGTGLTRYLKALKKAKKNGESYKGEDFIEEVM